LDLPSFLNYIYTTMKKILLSFICLACIISSCEDNKNAEQQALLVGSWLFENGTRNGNAEDAENLLNNLVFDFSDKSLKCDLLDEMQPGFKKEENYEIKENQIIVGKNLNMEIMDITQENLLLKFEVTLGDVLFEFDLKFKRQ
jgi:hypothetical protein